MKKLTLLAIAFGLLSMAQISIGPSSTSTPAITVAIPVPPRIISGTVILSGTPTHGVPLTVIIPTASSGLQVCVNGVLQGITNAAGGFTITFPTAGTYTLDVEGYPMRTLVVN
jgi:hypothetical protein